MEFLLHKHNCCAPRHKMFTSNLPSNGHGPVKDAMHAQNGRLWRVDDRCPKHRAEHPSITDGERATVHVLHSKFILTSLWEKQKKRSQKEARLGEKTPRNIRSDTFNN